MSGLTRAAMRGVVTMLEKLPAGAWLTRGTWERLTRGESKPGARLTRRGPGGVVLPGLQVLNAEVVDFEDVAAAGVRVVSGARRWVLGVRVVYDAALVPRLVTLAGNVVWREAELATLAGEVPVVVAVFDADGVWANEAPPVWRAAPEGDVNSVLTGGGEEVVAVSSPVPVVRGAPTFFARL